MNDERRDRLNRLRALGGNGINPYPSTLHKRVSISLIQKQFDNWKKKEKRVTVSGRIIALRLHGGLIFVHLADNSGVLQLFFKRDVLGEQRYAVFKDTVDRGDFIEATGTLMRTKTGVQTLLVVRWDMLAKTLRPLPDKWHGLADVEIRYRQRYLDLLSNAEVKRLFIIRAKLITELRSFLDKHSFIEVETPILQPLYGGAYANPFTTYYNALKSNFYLRIAPELYLKRLLVGGFEKVYEIGRCFRNEGIDHAHTPEFTMLEFYWAYSNYKDLMRFTEKLLLHIIKKVCTGTTVTYENHALNFTPPFPRITYTEAMKKYAGVKESDWGKKSALKTCAKKLGLAIEKNWSGEKILDELFKKAVRPRIIQPTFITDYPKALMALAKISKKNPHTVEAWQLVVAGKFELIKAFSEQNDPLTQRKQMKEQQLLRDAGDTEAQPLDEDFLTALEYGMPPASGFGMGIERLLLLLTNTHTIREVILFPTLRRKKL